MERGMRKMENKQKRFQTASEGKHTLCTVLYGVPVSQCIGNHLSLFAGAHSYFGIILQKCAGTDSEKQ